jgi:hypothetical protein
MISDCAILAEVLRGAKGPGIGRRTSDAFFACHL